MTLTRNFKETVKARAERDEAFREALLREGVECLLSGDVDTSYPYWGSTLDDFLKGEGIYQTTKTAAVERVVRWQLARKVEG